MPFCLVRFAYLAQLRVRVPPLRGKLRLLCSINLLAHQLLEHQLELSRVHSLRALADALSLKLQHHQLQTGSLDLRNTASAPETNKFDVPSCPLTAKLRAESGESAANAGGGCHPFDARSFSMDFRRIRQRLSKTAKLRYRDSPNFESLRLWRVRGT